MKDESILEDTRDQLGLVKDDTSFDGELKGHINAALSTLHQVGVGKPLFVEGVDEKWTDFIDEDQQNQNDYMFGQIRQYVFLKTKILFDPPPPSSVEYVSNAAEEMLWRLRENYDILKGGIQ